MIRELHISVYVYIIWYLQIILRFCFMIINVFYHTIFLFNIWKEVAQDRYNFPRIKLEILFLHSTPSEYKRNIIKWFFFLSFHKTTFILSFILLILFTM